MKTFANDRLESLTFAFNTSKVSQTGTTNKKVTLHDIVSILTTTEIPASFISISQITIDGFNNNLDEKKIKELINPLKLNLNYFLMSGFQEKGHNNKEIEYNGCIQIDIDIKRRGGHTIATQIKKELQKLPYIVLAGISPSGMGVKALVSSDSFNIADHTNAANLIFAQIRKDLGIAESEKWFDSLGASQPCFVFYDSDLYVNYNAETFHIDLSLVEKQKKATQKVKEVVQRGAFQPKNTESVSKAVNISYYYANKKCGGLFNTAFLQKYCPFVSAFGVDADTAYQFLIEQGHAEDLNYKRTLSFYDIYRRVEDGFGTINIEQEETENIPNMTYMLTADQKLSDLGITIEKSSILQSPTGSGKTFWVAQQEGKKIIVVPTQGLVRQCAAEYGFSEYYEDKKEISDAIAVTYNSFNVLCEYIKVSEYDVYIDESHNFTSSTNESFQLKNLRNVLERMQDAKKYVLLTATPLFNYSDVINDLDIIKVEKVDTIKKNIIKVNYEDRLSTIEKLVQNSKDNNRFTAILLNNTKEEGEFGRIKNLLSAYKTISINSNNKTSDDFQNIIIEGEISDDIDTMISTTVLAEGISIVKHKKEIDVIIIGAFHPSLIEQYAARFRNAEVINLYILKKITTDEKKSFFSKEAIKKQILDAALEESQSLNENIKRWGNYSKKQAVEFSNKMVGNLVYLNDEEISVDYLAMSNMLYNEEMFFLHIMFNDFVKYMTKYGWLFSGELTESSELDSSTKADIKDKTKEAKESKLEIIKEIIEDIRTDGKALNEYKIELCKDKVEKNIRFRINYIASMVDKFDDAIDIYNTIGYSENSWKEFRSKYSIQKLKNTEEFTSSNTAHATFFNSMYSTFTIDSTYSSVEINEMVNELRRTILKSKQDWSQKKTNLFLRDFFAVETKVVKNEDNKAVRVYKVTSDYTLSFPTTFNKPQEEGGYYLLFNGFLQSYEECVF